MFQQTSMRTTPLLLLSLLTGSLAAQTWTQLTPNPFANVTQLLRSGGFAAHPAAGLVLYGGLRSTPTTVLNETWSFDGANWTQLTPNTTPPTRWGHRMVYDSRRGKLVTFGGRSPTTTATANDTWEFDGVDWQRVFPTTSPNARAFYSMVYDSRRGVCVLYGTQSGSTVGTSGGNQTWEYDGTTWRQVVTNFVPPGLETPAMAYDEARGVTVMFGGYNGTSPGTMYNSTWEYDGSNWVLRTTATSPIGRYRASCGYDSRRGRVVLYGGFGNATALQDTWEYDGNNWTQVATAGPAKSTEAYFAYLPAIGGFAHFGGSGPAGTINETWLYAGASSAIAAGFGRGCATSAGLPSLQPNNNPILGTVHVLDLTGAPNASFGVFMTGLSNAAWSFGLLPADLTAFGYGGCRLEVSPDTSIFAVFPAGSGSHALTLPNATALVDLALFTQCFVLDAAAPNSIGGASNAVHSRLGN